MNICVYVNCVPKCPDGINVQYFIRSPTRAMSTGLRRVCAQPDSDGVAITIANAAGRAEHIAPSRGKDRDPPRRLLAPYVHVFLRSNANRWDHCSVRSHRVRRHSSVMRLLAQKLHSSLYYRYLASSCKKICIVLHTRRVQECDPFIE